MNRACVLNDEFDGYKRSSNVKKKFQYSYMSYVNSLDPLKTTFTLCLEQIPDAHCWRAHARTLIERYLSKYYKYKILEVYIFQHEITHNDTRKPIHQNHITNACMLRMSEGRKRNEKYARPWTPNFNGYSIIENKKMQTYSRRYCFASEISRLRLKR